MNAPESKIVERLAVGFAWGHEVCRQNMSSKEAVAAFHGLCLEVLPKMQNEKEAGAECARIMHEAWEKMSHGELP